MIENEKVSVQNEQLTSEEIYNNNITKPKNKSNKNNKNGVIHYINAKKNQKSTEIQALRGRACPIPRSDLGSDLLFLGSDLGSDLT